MSYSSKDGYSALDVISQSGTTTFTTTLHDLNVSANLFRR